MIFLEQVKEHYFLLIKTQLISHKRMCTCVCERVRTFLRSYVRLRVCMLRRVVGVHHVHVRVWAHELVHVFFRGRATMLGYRSFDKN